MPRDISAMGNQLPWSFSKALTSLVPLTKEPLLGRPATICGPRQFPWKGIFQQAPRPWEKTLPSVPQRNCSQSKNSDFPSDSAELSSLQSNSVVFPLNPSYSPTLLPTCSNMFLLYSSEDLVLPFSSFSEYDSRRMV